MTAATRAMVIAGLLVATHIAPVHGAFYLYHPEVSGAYVEAIEQIRNGLEDATNQPVASITYRDRDSESNALTVQGSLDENDTVFTIGDAALASLWRIGVRARVIAGALDRPPGVRFNGVGISAYASPAQYFALLSALLPSVTRVHFVHRAELPPDFVELVAEQAERAGLVIDSHAVDSLRDAATAIDRVLVRSTSNQAVWLHRGVLELNAELLLPPTLEGSWSRRVAVFSSAAFSVPRGLLFSLYPNYYALGQALGALARKDATGGGLRFLTSTRAALNTRTARHLGANLPPAIRERFHLVFPAPP